MTRRLALACCAATLFVGCDGDPGVMLRDTGTADDGGPMMVDAGGPGTDAGMDAGPVCVDSDEDGYGQDCALGPDCDDEDPAISPAATEICNGADDDCDGSDDEDLTGPTCALSEGVCAGAVARCGGTAGFLECDATDYGTDFEATESLCDGEDNDCDGSTDEGCSCTDGNTQACGTDVGVCMEGMQTCTGGTWGPCEGEIGPMGEVCDGEDNDCDNTADEPGDLTAPACPLQLGVCAGSTRRCGPGGWLACSGTLNYGTEYQPQETICDGLDNDCDGITDEGCSCIDGNQQGCGSDIGACAAGTQTCTAGAWGGCAGEVAPNAETCNGADDDCDGSTDEALVAPACPLQVGVCAGSAQTCTGAGGFAACTAASYGTSYQATESSCDGFDNDCDGTVDEGCACIDGATQECGSSIGACERGTQTCGSGQWGPCTGGVGPRAETCNGQDDDCNGASDDALTPPACALSSGVCAGSRQTCGGAAGWVACSGTDSYGPNYRATEPGGTDENICDGLDNDCNAVEDDGCASGPVANTANDEVLPDISNRHIVYSVNFDGNWDVVFHSLTTGETRRLTTTPQSELYARVYGNYVVYVRDTETVNARVFLHDLTTNVVTPLSTRQSDHPVIAGAGFIAFEEFDGTQWDIHYYDIASRMGGSVLVANTTQELRPSLRGGQLAYVGNATGTFLTYLVEFATGTQTMQTPTAMSVHGQGSPMIDYLGIAWNDGRLLPATPTGTPTDNIDIFGAPFTASGGLNAFPGENVIVNAMNAQYLADIDGAVLVWNDYRAGNWNPWVGDFAGGAFALSTHPGTQADPTISGNIILWEDNRLGNFDIYGSSMAGAVAPEAGWLIINEILADPAGDANGDGTTSAADDELVEIVNVTGFRVDLSGITLSDAVGVKHTFPAGTVIPAFSTMVVFGGAGVGATSLFGGARVQLATTGGLGLNNDGDTVTLRVGATMIDTVTYGTAANNNESIVRNPELVATGTFVRHSTMTGSIGAFTPGTSVYGFAF